MAKVKVLFNGATKPVEVDEADAMQFVERGEARILKGYGVAIASPYNTATAARPGKERK